MWLWFEFYDLKVGSAYIASFVVLGAMGGFLASGQAVLAQDLEARCQDYAIRSVSQNVENMRLHCNFSGRDWDSNRTVHFNVCLQTPQTKIEEIWRSRSQQLMTCHARGSMITSIERICRDYANQSTAQTREALSLACGFTGERWGTAYGDHFQFCVNASERQREIELTARSSNLRNCRTDAGDNGVERDEVCRIYAEEALQSTTENRQLACGLSGPEWGTDFVQHYNWCMGADREIRDSVRQKRASELQRCKSSIKGDAQALACHDYADQATEQNNENRRLACGLTGFRWQSSPTNHYAWCMTVSKDEQSGEIQAREESLTQCRADNAAGDSMMGCDGFVTQALRQMQKSDAAQCGFRGGRWTNSRAIQTAWCEAAPPAARARELADRERLLDLCTTRPEQAKTCRAYAGQAVEQQQHNLIKQCRFTGARWHSNFEEHFNWCMEQKPDQLTKESSARQEALSLCPR